MVKFILLLSIIFGFGMTINCQTNYRLKSVSGIEFLLPPKSKLGSEGLFGNKQSLQYGSRFRYHRILVNRLTGNCYGTFLEAISQAKYVYDDKAITSTWLSGNWNTTSGATVINASAKIYFSDNNEGFVLELDYSTIIANSEAFFNQLAIELYTTFRHKETASPNWPPSVCQEMVWKIFSLLPVPTASSLSALGFIQAPDYSLLLIHPRISLRIDHYMFDDRTIEPDVEAMDTFLQSLIDKSREAGSDVISVDTTSINNIRQAVDYKYVMTGQTIIQLYRVQNSANQVFFRQVPYLHRDMTRTLLPENNFKGNVHLGSSGDMELSARISTAPFLFLYQQYFNGNNSNSRINSSTIRNCCRQANNTLCTSLILFRQDVTELSEPVDYCSNPLANYASFGERALIVPVIPIFINGNLTYQPLGLKLADLLVSNLINKQHKLEREDRQGYRRIQKKENNIYLLPGDRISNL